MAHLVLVSHRHGLGPVSVIHDQKDWQAEQVVPLLY